MTTVQYHEMCPEMLKLRDLLDEMNIAPAYKNGDPDGARTHDL